MTDPTARALRLLSLLQTYKFWSGEDLAAQLEVSPRTLRRDVDRLRELGYPVDATSGTNGGYRLAAGAHLPPLLLDDDEAVAIAVGLRAAAGASIEGIEETSVRALAKLEQVLPDRLRRRVNAVHTNVSSMQWGVDTATVDADALAVLALACRDNEQVRFDYRRRDGAEAQRLVEPHNLVSAGRRWYLVGWDVRREDWRTFRLDRLDAPRLGGVRFRPRELPATNAAAFVAASIAAMPVLFEATIIAFGSDTAVRNLIRHANGKVEAINDTNCRVLIRSDSRTWLVTVVALLATEFDIVVEEPAELLADVKRLGLRLRAVVTRSAK
ncbi:MAG: helix-turn-helix transcriptional regulator [Acidimicrobiia bacterium]